MLDQLKKEVQALSDDDLNTLYMFIWSELSDRQQAAEFESRQQSLSLAEFDRVSEAH